MATVAYIDGLAQPTNPGTGTYAFVIYQDEKKIAEDCGLAGRNVTNNFAEYYALVMALSKLKSIRALDDITVRSDSKLLVGQMGEGWKVKGGGYIEKFKEARDLTDEFVSIRYEWIPREQNQEADLLSKIAYNRYSRRGS